VSLTILSIGFPFAPVGRDAAGGSEQILSTLDEALVAAGHHSIVLGCEGSTAAGTLLAAPAVTDLDDAVQREAAQARYRSMIADALARWPVDLIHMHSLDFAAYLPAAGVPTLITLHLPPSWYPDEALRPARPGTYLNCVSQAQRVACPAGVAVTAVVPNGVPVDRLSARHAKRRYALTLGRICPEKGMHIALDAARRADMPMLLAGALFGYAAHERYFAEEIQPRLDARRRFIGVLDFRRKRRFLSAACCLVVPSLVAETSSLVAMEAMACGTPVIAFASGALAEVIEDGRTGFIVHDESGMAQAIARCSEIDPEICRETARRRFSSERMAADYMALYRTILGRRAASAA
jgi:glycosyltransferase involved in cell wall biosynthesis